MDDSSRERLRALELENAALRVRLAQGPSPSALSNSEPSPLSGSSRIAHVGTWVWELATGNVQWSDELYRILGYDRSAVKPSSQAFFAAIHPDDREHVQRAAQRALEESTTKTVEFRLARTDGTVRQVYTEGSPLIAEDGHKSHLIGAVLDLTEVLQATALLSRTVDDLRIAQRLAHMGSYLIELPSLQSTWSTGLCELLELGEDDVPSTELFFQRVHPEDRENARQMFDELIKSGAVVVSELRMVKKDGSIWHAYGDCVPQRDSTGQVVAIRGVVQDVTRRKTEEERLRHSEKMAAVGTLAGGIAHDFNNYLTVLMGEAELLRLTVDDTHRSARSLDAILTAAERCSQLTSQLLTLSRKRSSQPERFELGALLTRMTPMLRSVLGECIELVVQTDGAKLFIRADSTALEHALINLAVNARDAMGGNGRFTLSLKRVGGERAEAPPPIAQLSVTDTGAGIDPEVIPRIFEPFFTTKGVGKGTGLGLSTVYSVVEQAGGHVDVDSELGQGTTFRVSLPLDETVATPSVPLARAESAGAASTNKTILVVEDVPELRAVIRDQLAAAGYQVQTAEHGRAALDLLASAGESIDAVLSDVVMPVLGGFELEKALRERYPHIRCALMTGYAERGADGSDARIALRKPFSGKELLGVIQSLWRQESGINAPTALPRSRELSPLTGRTKSY